MNLAGTLSFTLLAAAMVAGGAQAPQTQTQPQAQPGPTAQHRNLWIAKFTCEAKAAGAVAATQHHDADVLEFSNLFDNVVTFDKQGTPPQGSWSLTGNEVQFTGGNTAERALIGFGAGRQAITMEYSLSDPSGKVVWKSKIRTKPSYFGSAGGFGALQDQGAAEDQQAQKLVAMLSKFFGVVPPGKHS